MPKRTIPKAPNSIPLKGSTLKNPPNPRMLNKPKAHEGQAGVIIPTKSPDMLMPIPEVCLRKRKKPKANTIPAKREVNSRNKNAIEERLWGVAAIKLNSSDREKSEKSIW